MVARSVALSFSVLFIGCMVHTHETPDSSMTSTTRATNATAPTPYDPHFQVSNEIYESCQLASNADKTNMDVAEGTAACLKSGTMSDKKVRITGSQPEVDNARARLVGWGVAIDRIYADYEDGPAKVEIQTLNKRKR